MSIYHHVSNKAELLQLVVDDALAPNPDHGEPANAIEALEAFARQLRATMQHNPGFGPLIAERLPRSWLDHRSFNALAQLIDDGFDEQAATWIIDAFVGSVLGLATMEVAATGRTVENADASFETGLRLLVAGLRLELGA